MKKLSILLIAILSIALLVNTVSAVSVESEVGGSGAIWTTMNDCGDAKQDVNEYNIGDVVFINGDNFDEGNYDWSIKGQPGNASCDPGIVVANGTYAVDETGAFCFEAYIVQEGDCGVYKIFKQTGQLPYNSRIRNCNRNSNSLKRNRNLLFCEKEVRPKNLFFNFFDFYS